MYRAFSFVCAVGLSWTAFSSALAAEPAKPAAPTAMQTVTVKTFDDREFTGVVDERTDDQALWLRREEHGVVLTTAVPWGELTTAAVDKAPVEVAALRDDSRSMATTATLTLAAEVNNPLTVSALGSFAGGVCPPSAGRPPRVRNIEILAVGLVNVDRDVEPDGLEVTIAAIGDDGRPMSVRGNLAAELTGERRSLERPEVEFNTLGRWSEPVRHSDFVEGATTYILPLRMTAPEWEFDLLPDAVLTVRLGAAGHGNFAASAPVLLREFSPLRDNLQQAWGTRFTPGELTGRRPLNRFGPQRGLWLHWTR